MKSRLCFGCLLGLMTVLSSVASVQADLATGLTAYWRLDESGGPVAHDSVGTYSATLNGDASFVNDRSRGYVSSLVPRILPTLWSTAPIPSAHRRQL